MPKIKTNSGAAKRFRRRASGAFKCKHANLRHILTKKPSYRKRRLRKGMAIAAADHRMVRRMVPYS